VLTRYDLSKLRVVPVSGSALPGAISEKWMDCVGENLYNLYGSTEVAWATIATPQDLRAAPGTAGKPPRGTIVRLYDDDGKPIDEVGKSGRIFVGNDMQFEGYTGGGNKDVIDGLMSSGDVGHFDEEGRLFIDGRDDDMIVSGGENVFPSEVEELLAKHKDVVEATVFGVEDEKFGQRLKAVVVKRGSAKLTEEAVKAYVKENLAGYKVPRDVEFVKELPRTSTGKVLKRELQEQKEEE
jgi:fatty-acyl-CoA synthase